METKPEHSFISHFYQHCLGRDALKGCSAHP